MHAEFGQADRAADTAADSACRRLGMIVRDMTSPYALPAERAYWPRTCTRCGHLREYREFPVPSVRPNGNLRVASTCNPCRAELAAEYAAHRRGQLAALET